MTADWRARQGTDWFDQMMLVGMLTCAEHGYRLIVELVDTHSDRIECELPAAIAALQPDRTILTPPHSGNPLIINLLEAQGISFARIGSLTDGPGIRLIMDDTRAARIATEHLVELGHRRIGFIAGPAKYELNTWRADGWRTAMQAADRTTDDLLAVGDFRHASGRAATSDRLALSDPPTATLLVGDPMIILKMAD